MLESIWFLLWGLLWAIYFMLDGYDLGLGSVMPFLAKDEKDRKKIYKSIGPFWDGNEVWLITAGGVTFAAFPKAYAVMFSGLYTALMLLLIALIIRGVAYEFRGLVDSDWARKLWDKAMVLGSFLPGLLLGVAFANIFMGIPIDENGVFQGNLFTLLNPYGLGGGILFVLLFAQHGCLWLAARTDGELNERAGNLAATIWPVLAAVYIAFLALTGVYTKLLSNFIAYPALLLILLVPILAIVKVRTLIAARKWWKAWISSAVLIVSTTMFGVIGLFPALLPSSINPAYSITIHNAASSQLTLKIMLTVALIMVPIVIGYQFWMHKVFATKITDEDLGY
ncbi:cytochrome d ubiquinol oxidase subunit II [Maridesulfovibrio salexigens]|uniref:Cytochrome d ubiquinol oxidase, subunit II n=1 Tax=Maridesulfovibrio salexigens (strain ATCC 14822 / DSM 2638 / NCIMB 8403 / VKM B-1763) TaxID=526222 RepID=C6BV16_MARSD|nr:cytochrome d ubiquinol oxidase subunit II [Maridesulfovibrio salexigens]ACS78153.1 cytochrome d ubiquinol oxidase, subunit II [Maridesulfovibrio salexigens DSM 2638]